MFKIDKFKFLTSLILLLLPLVASVPALAQSPSQPGIKMTLNNLQVAGDQITGSIGIDNLSELHYLELYYTVALYSPGITRNSTTNGKVTPTTSKGSLVSYKKDRIDLANKAKSQITFGTAYNKKLQSGNYSLSATVETSDGQILGTASATQAIQADNSGFVIDPLSCGVFVNGVDFNNSDGPVVKSSDKAYVECLVESLNQITQASSQVSYKIDYASRDLLNADSQDIKTYTGSEKVIFNPGEKKKLRFLIPSVETPQVYQAYIYLLDSAGNQVSAAAPFRWIVPGPSAFIKSVNLDKDSYKKDEVMKVSIEPLPSMDLYWQGRALTIKSASNSASLNSGTQLVGAKLKVIVQNKAGLSCGSKEQDLPEAKTATSWQMQVIDIPSSRDCDFPIVKTEISYQGQTLASLNKSMPVLVTPEIVKKQQTNRILWIVISVIIILAIAGAIIYKRRKGKGGSGLKTSETVTPTTSVPTKSSVPVALILGAGLIISSFVIKPALVIGQSATPSASIAASSSPVASASPWSCQLGQSNSCPLGYSCQSTCNGANCDTNNGLCRPTQSPSPAASAASSSLPSSSPVASASGGFKPPVNNPLSTPNISIKRGFIDSLNNFYPDDSYINYTNFVQVDPAGSSSVITDSGCGPIKLKLVGYSTNDFVCDNKKAGIRYLITIDGKPAQLSNVTSPDSNVTLSSAGPNSFDVWEIAGTRTADLDVTLAGGIPSGNHKIEVKVIGLGLTDMQHNGNFYSAVFTSSDNLSNKASLASLYPNYPGFPMDWTKIPDEHLNNCGANGECFGLLTHQWTCERVDMCNETCTDDLQCGKATDGCTSCVEGASGSKTCQKPPACNTSCTSPNQCLKAGDGCTACVTDATGANGTCKTPPACGSPCQVDSQCAQGCSACVNGSCQPPPACGSSCSTKADCSRAKDNCSECLEGSCTDFSDSMCKCDGIVADMSYPNSAFKFEAFGKVDGKDAQKAEIADVTFRMTKDNQVIAKSSPITPEVVQNDPSKVRFKAAWQTAPPQVSKNSTYRVFADVRCKPKRITAQADQNYSPAPALAAAPAQLPPKGLKLAMEGINKLFGGSNEKVNKITSKVLGMFATSTVNAQGTNLQLQTLNFVKLMDTDNCRFVMFKYDETLF